MRKYGFFALITILLISNSGYSYAYELYDLAQIECLNSKYGEKAVKNLSNLENCVSPKTSSSNPIRKKAEESIKARFKPTFKDYPMNYFIEPNLSDNYLKYAKSVSGLARDFWGEQYLGTTSIIISSRSSFYRESICKLNYELNLENFNNCITTPLENFRNYWPESDNPNSFGAVFNYIAENNPGNEEVRYAYPSLNMYLNQNHAQSSYINKDFTRSMLHEFVHMAQWGSGSKKEAKYLSENNFFNNAPQLFVEGSAQYIGTALNAIYLNGEYDTSFAPRASWLGSNFNSNVLELRNLSNSEIQAKNSTASIYYSGGLMTELFVANFGVESLIKLNTCLADKAKGAGSPFESCFTMITGNLFSDWALNASKYVKNVHAGLPIIESEYSLEALPKPEQYPKFSIGEVKSSPGYSLVTLIKTGYGVKEYDSLKILDENGVESCDFLKSNYSCVVENSILSNDNQFIVQAWSGNTKIESLNFSIEKKVDHLFEISNLNAELDNSSNHEQNMPGINNSIVNISWDKFDSEASVNYEVLINGCLNDAGVAVAKNLSTTKTSIQTTCVTNFNSLNDALKIKVRVNGESGASKWVTKNLKPENSTDVNSVYRPYTLKKTGNSISYVGKPTSKNLNVEYKAYIRSTAENPSSFTTILDPELESVELSSLLNNLSGGYNIYVIARAKGSNPYNWGTGVKSNELKITFKAESMAPSPKPSPSVTPLPKSSASPSPTVKVPIVVDGVKIYPIASPSPKVSTKPTSKASPKPTSKASPKSTSKASPKPTSKVSPKPTSKVSPKQTSKASPKPTSKASPKATIKN